MIQTGKLGNTYLGASPNEREIVLQIYIPVIIIGVGLEAQLKTAGEGAGQHNLSGASGNEHGIDDLVILIVETEGVVAWGGRHGDNVVGQVNEPRKDGSFRSACMCSTFRMMI